MWCGSENQSVGGVTIYLMKRERSPCDRGDQSVDCGLWNVVPLLFSRCAQLLDVGGNWNTLSYTLIQSITCLVSMHSMEELGHFQFPGIVYRPLQHVAMQYHAET